MIALMQLLPVCLLMGIPMVLRKAAVEGPLQSVARTGRVFSLASLPVSLAIGGAVSSAFHLNETREVAILIVVLFSTVSAGMIFVLDANCLVAQGRNGSYASVSLVGPIFGLLAIVSLYMLGRLTVISAIAAAALNTLASAGMTLFLVPGGVRGHRISLNQTIRSGLRFMGGDIAEMASLRLPLIVAVPIIGAYQSGLYSISLAISALPYALGQALGVGVFRQMSLSLPAPDAFNRLAASVVRGSFVLTVGLMGIAGVFCPFLVPRFFGRQFSGAVAPTLICLVGSVGIVLSYVSSSLLAAQGYGICITRAQSAGLGLTLVLLLMFGSGLGALGAALSSTMGLLLTASLATFGLHLGSAALRLRKGDVRVILIVLFRGDIRDSVIPIGPEKLPLAH